VNSLNTTKMHELSLKYKESSLPVSTDYFHGMLRREYMNILDTYPEAQYAVADLFATVADKSIIIHCRCKTVEALNDLEQFIESAKLDQHFSDIMYFLVPEPFSASVSTSHEDFIRCRMSLNDGAG